MNAMTSPRAGVTVAELPPATRISLRLADPAAAGLSLPTAVGARSTEGSRTALCLGPDEWLVEAPEADRDALLAALAGISQPHSAVEVSDREITYALEGPAVLDLLATGCPRDLARLAVGAGTRTVFDTAQVVLTREAEDRFHLTVWRSFAPHVRALLDLAARELATGL
ncbi:MAG TPA: sarcosine oxidase subunit gamma family protein [Amaricoccus sp.]|uniref:sarcosine oxidase subunit gamma n=1 Tax=Amaricoccus sp. TaxID=1872485 RepID=UPI002C303084|nr:sarcosine oxidase subunit gamma family protein [Amaricoccus sp.]HRO12843.1 sarcosine oxidase subunit gamma family protein [Amaricoccus sp.]